MPVTIEELLLATAIIAVGFLAAAFYESLSTREVLVARVLRVARRATRRRWLLGTMPFGPRQIRERRPACHPDGELRPAAHTPAAGTPPSHRRDRHGECLVEDGTCG